MTREFTSDDDDDYDDDSDDDDDDDYGDDDDEDGDDERRWIGDDELAMNSILLVRLKIKSSLSFFFFN